MIIAEYIKIVLIVFILLCGHAIMFGQGRQVTLGDVHRSLEGSSTKHARGMSDVFFPTHEDECSRELVTIGLNGWGRVSGMNAFGDLEKAQRLRYEGTARYTVVGAFVFFERPSVVGDGSIHCKVYSVGSDAAPFAIKGFSKSVRVSQIAVADSLPTPTYFAFDGGVDVILEEPAFFLSVDLANLYQTRDTVVVLQTNPECGLGSDTWDLFADGSTWAPISSSNSWEMNADYAINAVVDFDEPTNTQDYFSIGGLQLFPAYPTPSATEVRFNFSLDRPSSVEVRIFDVEGVQVDHLAPVPFGQGRNQINYQNQHLPAGTYIYQLKSENGAISSRFVKV